MAVVAVIIRVTMGRPVLYRQRRAGRGGRPFELVKFRTMRVAAPGYDDPRFDKDRLTAVGIALRASSLDELPTLWNVVRGDMSLVGPRPLPVRYVPRYDATQARRLEVRPGVTGWAQVNGRNRLPWDERFRLDVWYVDNLSLLLDLRIVARTVRQVTRREGINPEGEATMPEFGSTGVA